MNLLTFLFESTEDPFTEVDEDDVGNIDTQIDRLELEVKDRTHWLRSAVNKLNRSSNIVGIVPINWLPSKATKSERELWPIKLGGSIRNVDEQELAPYIKLSNIGKKLLTQRVIDHDRLVQERKDNKASARHASKGNKVDSQIAAGNTIPANLVPAKVHTGAGWINNPYHSAANGQYAGDIGAYPFSTVSKATVDSINQALVRNGIPPLKTLYAGFREKYIMLNCIAIGGRNNDVVWYKYDAGGGSGQNYLYLNGVKHSTSELAHLQPAAQDAFLAKHYKG